MSVLLRVFIASTLLLAPAALAEGDCEEDFLECKEDCLIEFGGSVRVEVKKRFDKCMKKCTKVGNRCAERVSEVKNNNLDEGALDGTPTSDQVDAQGMPTRTSAKSSKKKRASEPAPDESAAEDEAPVKREKLDEAEVPKSNRTKLKVDEPASPPPPPKEEKAKVKEEPVEKAEAPPKKEVIEMRMTPRKEEEDLRDDRPKASAPQEEEPPPPPPKKKAEEKKPAPKKEEDHDDLRNY